MSVTAWSAWKTLRLMSPVATLSRKRPQLYIVRLMQVLNFVCAMPGKVVSWKRSFCIDIKFIDDLFRRANSAFLLPQLRDCSLQQLHGHRTPLPYYDATQWSCWWSEVRPATPCRQSFTSGTHTLHTILSTGQSRSKWLERLKKLGRDLGRRFRSSCSELQVVIWAH